MPYTGSRLTANPALNADIPLKDERAKTYATEVHRIPSASKYQNEWIYTPNKVYLDRRSSPNSEYFSKLISPS